MIKKENENHLQMINFIRPLTIKKTINKQKKEKYLDMRFLVQKKNTHSLTRLHAT